MKVTLPNHWHTRPYQDKAWRYLQAGGKRYVGVNHRRWGKDKVCLNWAAVAAHKRKGSLWHMLPEASQARKAIWDAVDEFTGDRLIDQAFPKELRATTRESDMFIRFHNGSTWQVVGSDNYDSLIGSPPVGVVFSEYAYANPAAWQKISPILANNGGWAAFISTPFGRNHFHGLHQHALAEMAAGNDWFTEVQTARDTGVFSEQQILAELRQLTAERGAQEANSIIQQEYYCSFEAAIPGAYYGAMLEEMERMVPTRITSVPHDPAFPVQLWADLGIRDDSAWWFVQKVGREHRIIDYYETAGKGIDHYAAVFRGRCNEISDGDNLRRSRYTYAEPSSVLPHDAGHAQLTSRGGASFAQSWRDEYGFSNKVNERTNSLAWSINQTRAFLPTCIFDAENTRDGLEKLRQYRRKWNPATRAYHDVPAHDSSCHAADALRTGVESVQYDRQTAIIAPSGIPHIGTVGYFEQTTARRRGRFAISSE